LLAVVPMLLAAQPAGAADTDAADAGAEAAGSAGGAAADAVAAPRAHIIQVVADDLGYDDLGHDSVMGNSGKSLSPNINKLMDDGIILHDYYTFKVCSPTRASLLTGRYPWGAGFYDMSDDGDHCTDQFKLVAELLKETGYTTHALGKVRGHIVAASCLPLSHQRLLRLCALPVFSGTLGTSLSHAPQHVVASIRI
jgi:hypothetical protein